MTRRSSVAKNLKEREKGQISKKKRRSYFNRKKMRTLLKKWMRFTNSQKKETSNLTTR
jgi:hypothetical protein